MKRTIVLITLIVFVAMFGLLWTVLPASAQPPQEPIALPALQSVSRAQPIGAPSAPEGGCAANAIPTSTLTFTATQDAYV